MRALVFASFVLLSILEVVSARLVAIGDIHGDLAQYQAILQLSELTDKQNEWIGGNSTLVQVGDLLDRGPDDVAILQYSQKLQQEAKTAGGKIVFLLGNHEIMNLQGQFHYVHPQSMEDTGSRAERRERFSKDGDLGKFIRTFDLLYTEEGSVFVHAGLSAEYARQGIEQLNLMAKDALSNDDFKSPIFASNGPVWTRSLINEASHGRCGKVADSLEALGLERMIIGHTPQRSGSLETYCDDSLIAIDVGISKHMYGHLAALELTTNSETGALEMREISGKYFQPEDEAEKDTPTGLEEALKDQHLLQEIMETVEEAGKKKILEKDDAEDGAANGDL